MESFSGSLGRFGFDLLFVRTIREARGGMAKRRLRPLLSALENRRLPGDFRAWSPCLAGRLVQGEWLETGHRCLGCGVGHIERPSDRVQIFHSASARHAVRTRLRDSRLQHDLDIYDSFSVGAFFEDAERAHKALRERRLRHILAAHAGTHADPVLSETAGCLDIREMGAVASCGGGCLPSYPLPRAKNLFFIPNVTMIG